MDIKKICSKRILKQLSLKVTMIKGRMDRKSLVKGPIIRSMIKQIQKESSKQGEVKFLSSWVIMK